MVLHRRRLIRRSTTTQGVLADVALPGLVALAHYFSKQLRTTVAILEPCVDDERVVIALDSAESSSLPLCSQRQKHGGLDTKNGRCRF